MACYQPETLLQKLLLRLEGAPGYIGRSSRRKLKRRYVRRALSSFDACLEKLGPGDVVFDFGANYGKYTTLLARTGAIVHAFEPDPDTYKILCQKVAGFPNVVAHMKAVGQMNGVVKLRRLSGAQDNHEYNSQGSSVVFDDERMNSEDVVDVEMVSFWDVIDKINGPVKLIKMDIEGAEWDILEAMFKMPQLPNVDHCFIETHEMIDNDKMKCLDEYRKAACLIEKPDINLYWV